MILALIFRISKQFERLKLVIIVSIVVVKVPKCRFWALDPLCAMVCPCPNICMIRMDLRLVAWYTIYTYMQCLRGPGKRTKGSNQHHSVVCTLYYY